MKDGDVFAISGKRDFSLECTSVGKKIIQCILYCAINVFLDRVSRGNVIRSSRRCSPTPSERGTGGASDASHSIAGASV